MRKSKRNSGVWNYLNQLGILETGTEDEIQAARKKYWNEYARLRQIKKRKAEKREIVVSFPADEINHVRSVAKAKGYSIQNYMRACVKADMQHITVIPHSMLVAQVMQVLRQCYTQLEAIRQKEGKAWFAISGTYENVETVLNQTENILLDLLKRPKKLKDVIVEAISQNPGTIHLLKLILAQHGSDQINDEKDGKLPPAD